MIVPLSSSKASSLFLFSHVPSSNDHSSASTSCFARLSNTSVAMLRPPSRAASIPSRRCAPGLVDARTSSPRHPLQRLQRGLGSNASASLTFRLSFPFPCGFPLSLGRFVGGHLACAPCFPPLFLGVHSHFLCNPSPGAPLCATLLSLVFYCPPSDELGCDHGRGGGQAGKDEGPAHHAFGHLGLEERRDGRSVVGAWEWLVWHRHVEKLCVVGRSAAG